MDEIVNFTLRVVVPCENTWPMVRKNVSHRVELDGLSLRILFDYLKSMKEWSNIGFKGGAMLEYGTIVAQMMS